jgi:hypothetical protein
MDVDTVYPTSSVPTWTEPDHAQRDGAPFIEPFPSGAAGAPISNVGQSMPRYQALWDGLGPDNIWYPFQSQRDWDFAQWAKSRGPSSTAVTELLAINSVSTQQREPV